MPTPLIVSEVFKSFTMHLRDGIELPVVRDVSFSVSGGECVVLGGPSGIGKSSILKMLYGNYAIDSGQILIRHEDQVIDMGSASPRTILEIRHRTIGYVSQFLRTVPRVPAIDVVAEPLLRARLPRKRPASRQPFCFRNSTCRGNCGRCRQQPFPAASSSASTSHAVSSPITRSCFSMNRPHPRMPPTDGWSWR